ncbi:MAG: Fe-S cluster assembly protein IscX [Anaerolineales bacterium]|nr:Fe-S cluster assembly protein IscX [Anaerolineales bacterium]
MALKAHYPHETLDALSLGELFQRVVALPGFADDPELANDEILAAIYQEWFEEINPV